MEDGRVAHSHADVYSGQPPKLARVVLYGNSVLRDVAEPVVLVDPETFKIVDLMSKVVVRMSALGIAAPQLGIRKRIIVINKLTELVPVINPRVVSLSEDEYMVEEGCLSFPGASGKVYRAKSVQVEGLDMDMNPVLHEFTGVLANVAQHEIDHLDGILFIDHLELAARGLAIRKFHKAVRKLQFNPLGYSVNIDGVSIPTLKAA